MASRNGRWQKNRLNESVFQVGNEAALSRFSLTHVVIVVHHGDIRLPPIVSAARACNDPNTQKDHRTNHYVKPRSPRLDGSPSKTCDQNQETDDVSDVSHKGRYA